MDQKRQRHELEERLARCRKLAREFIEGITAKNLRELAAEIEQEIRALDGPTRRRPAPAATLLQLVPRSRHQPPD